MCQSHDCRERLDQLHYANPDFKVTLFAIPGEMTQEILNWCRANRSWVELAVHGFYHTSNYECDNITYEEFNDKMLELGDIIDIYFVKGFKAPGWQISEGAYSWLKDNGWWIADQSYNNDRRPKEIPAYVNNGGEFYVQIDDSTLETVAAWHGHTWDCVGNGIYETFDRVKSAVEGANEFKFVSEILNA